MSNSIPLPQSLPSQVSTTSPHDPKTLPAAKSIDQGSPSAPNTSIEVGNFLITLKKDPLQLIDSALDTTASRKSDSSTKPLDQNSPPFVSQWNRKLPAKPKTAKPSVQSRAFQPSGKALNALLQPQTITHTPKLTTTYETVPKQIAPLDRLNTKQSKERYFNREDDFRRGPRDKKETNVEFQKKFEKWSRPAHQPIYQRSEIRVKNPTIKETPEKVYELLGPSPQKPQSAYRMFVMDKYCDLRKQDPRIEHHQALKKANHIWLYETHPLDKEAYEHMFEQMEREYKKETEAYSNRKKYLKNEHEQLLKLEEYLNDERNEKVKFKTAFKLFKLDHVAEIKQKYPDANFKDRSEVLKKMWKALSPDSKFLYVQRSRLDKRKAILEKKMESIFQVQCKRDPQIRRKEKKEDVKEEVKEGETVKTLDKFLYDSDDANDPDYEPEEEQEGQSESEDCDDENEDFDDKENACNNVGQTESKQ